jgi:hypothetical protein
MSGHGLMHWQDANAANALVKELIAEYPDTNLFIIRIGLGKFSRTY